MTVLTSLVLAASDAEPSKTAFYICGALLAAWAVGLSLLGLTRSDFPATERASRGVIGLSVLLVIAVLTSAVATS